MHREVSSAAQVARMAITNTSRTTIIDMILKTQIYLQACSSDPNGNKDV